MGAAARHIFLLTFLSILALSGCGLSVRYDEKLPGGPEKLPGCPLEIFYPHSQPHIALVHLGSFNIGGTHLSMSCRTLDVIDRAKDLACRNGADVLQIHRLSKPSWFNKCHGIQGHLFKRKGGQRLAAARTQKQTNTHRANQPASLNQRSKIPPPSVGGVPMSVGTVQQGDRPRASIFRVSPKPQRIRGGQKYDLEVEYMLRSGTGKKPVFVDLSFQVLKGSTVLFSSEKYRRLAQYDVRTTYAFRELSSTKKPGQYTVRFFIKAIDVKASKSADLYIR